MSFDLYLHHFAVGESEPINPAPVQKVLALERYQGPNQFGFYVIEFPDGVGVKFNASGLDGTEPFSGCAFHIRGISPQLIQFVYDVAVAGDFVIFNCQGADTAESPVLILVAPEQEQQLDEALTAQYSIRPVCSSAEMLGNLLFVGYQGWQAYRDHIVGDA